MHNEHIDLIFGSPHPIPAGVGPLPDPWDPLSKPGPLLPAHLPMHARMVVLKVGSVTHEVCELHDLATDHGELPCEALVPDIVLIQEMLGEHGSLDIVVPNEAAWPGPRRRRRANLARIDGHAWWVAR